MAEDFKELNLAYEAEFQKQKNGTSRPMSQIEWFQSVHNEGTKWNTSKGHSNLQEILARVPREQFQKSLTDKRPDQIFRKTKICATLGKHTSNLVRSMLEEFSV